MKNLIIKFMLIFFVSLFLFSCDLPEGTGGKSTVRGHVYVVRYNSDFTRVIQEYYEPDERVFITYGKDTTTYHDDIRTHFDGSYEFRYLRPGTYSVYALTLDTNSITGRPKYAVIKTVEVKKGDDVIEVDDIIIVKN